jgi:uncharacterized MAPEG superfamily protein
MAKEISERSTKAQNPSPEEFEEFVAAALKVDPKGLSGKHRKEDGPEERPEPES